MSGGQRLPDVAALDWEERASGEPHPWPRVWTLSGRSLDSEGTTRRLETWLRETRRADLRRCGVAHGIEPNGDGLLVVVAVDAFADLASLPRTVRVGEWVTVEARLRVPAQNLKVFVLGPSGEPRALLASVDRASIRALFSPDRSGMFTVQVVGDVAGGTRPLLAATLFADIEAPSSPREPMAPGEEAGMAISNESDGLAAMVNAARAASGHAPLLRSAELDNAASFHALRMASLHDLAHDAGDGDPAERLAAAGIGGVELGENLGRARDIVTAHRQIWNSPSHRANLLSDRFRRAGFAVVRDEQGEAWIVEEFAGR